MRWPSCQDGLTIGPAQQTRSLAWLAKSFASLDSGQEIDLAASSAADLDRAGWFRGGNHENGIEGVLVSAHLSSLVNWQI